MEFKKVVHRNQVKPGDIVRLAGGHILMTVWKLSSSDQTNVMACYPTEGQIKTVPVPYLVLEVSDQTFPSVFGFDPGAVVQLRSGGRNMVVQYQNGDSVRLWWEGAGIVDTTELPVVLLKEID